MSGYFQFAPPSGGGSPGSGTMTPAYVQGFSVADWVLQGDGTYKILVPAGTHGKLNPITVETGILDGAEYDTVTVATEVDPTTRLVELSVQDAEDRFDGRVVIYGSN